MNSALGCWSRTKPKPRGPWFDFLLHKHFLIWKQNNVPCSSSGHLYTIWLYKEGADSLMSVLVWRAKKSMKLILCGEKPLIEFACLNFLLLGLLEDSMPYLSPEFSQQSKYSRFLQQFKLFIFVVLFFAEEEWGSTRPSLKAPVLRLTRGGYRKHPYGRYWRCSRYVTSNSKLFIYFLKSS